MKTEDDTKTGQFTGKYSGKFKQGSVKRVSSGCGDAGGDQEECWEMQFRDWRM